MTHQTLRLGKYWKLFRVTLTFNIFANDLFYSVKKAKLSAYADDKQLYFSHREALTLQHSLNSELAIVSKWISDNGLILNAKKCESLLFRRLYCMDAL